MASETTFFSYSRTDSAFVLKLAKDLRDAGAKLWLDQLDIKPGSRWDSSVEVALTNAPRLIVILSPASVSSNNVMDEVSFALESGKTIIPVLLSECTPPFRLRRLQHIDFTGDYPTALNQLLEALGQAAENNTSPVSLPQESDEQGEELENLLWEKAKAENTIDAYQHYVKEYPNGKYKTEALAAAKKVEQNKQRQTVDAPMAVKSVPEETPGKSRSSKYMLAGLGVVIIGLAIWFFINSGSNNNNQDRKAWNNALQQNDSSAYAAYRQNYPTGAYVAQANEKLDSLSNLNASTQTRPRPDTSIKPGNKRSPEEPTQQPGNTNTSTERTPIKRTPFYAVMVGSAENEREAKARVITLTRKGYAAGYLWIPDYASLSGTKLFAIYIGPFSTQAECEVATEEYRKTHPTVYGLLVSQDKKRVQINGIGKVRTTEIKPRE